ncbi:MAG: hypothetical protein R3A45_07965 [Bdellovibrionota bacterium]
MQKFVVVMVFFLSCYSIAMAQSNQCEEEFSIFVVDVETQAPVQYVVAAMQNNKARFGDVSGVVTLDQKLNLHYDSEILVTAKNYNRIMVRPQCQSITVEMQKSGHNIETSGGNSEQTISLSLAFTNAVQVDEVLTFAGYNVFDDFDEDDEIQYEDEYEDAAPEKSSADIRFLPKWLSKRSPEKNMSLCDIFHDVESDFGEGVKKGLDKYEPETPKPFGDEFISLEVVKSSVENQYKLNWKDNCKNDVRKFSARTIVLILRDDFSDRYTVFGEVSEYQVYLIDLADLVLSQKRINLSFEISKNYIHPSWLQKGGDFYWKN